ncbi:MAG TPA: hypothetical protein VNT23_07575 [Gaiellaceae bacterium]|nr:hypothetical protein [Gaiellaceae bacterium]
MSTVRVAVSDADLAAWTRVRNEVELAPSTTGSALHDAALGYARARLRGEPHERRREDAQSLGFATRRG